ncbi:MAG: RidA family protein [Roseibium album]|uniref:RidA family protein n=1 Tax=Roseibium album TaxID=311410 RepID=UPI0032EB810C
MPDAIVPSVLNSYVRDWNMSPGLEHGGFVFMTGFTGSNENGHLSSDPREQFEHAFEKVRLVLEEAGLGFEHIVEMTSYHVGLREHLELFKEVRAATVSEPYPAWTAIEVAGFVRDGAVVELRCIARRT